MLFPAFLRGSSCLDALSPACHGYSSVAQTCGTRLCSPQNRDVARDILQKSASMLMFDQKIGGFAFKEVLLEGVVSEVVALLFEQNRALARDILKISGFYLGHSKIALPRETIRLLRRLDHLYIFKNRAPVRSTLNISSIIFIENDENDAPVWSIRKIWIIYER